MVKVTAGQVVPPLTEKESFWDTFEHVLLFISLYVFATSFTLILHEFINVLVPNSTSRVYSYFPENSFSKTLVRGYMASLIVSYPLFSYFLLRVKQRVLKFPQIIHLQSRKRLIYMTLITTFVIVLINIISIVIGLLNGNITWNFILHFLATVSVAGIIFTYLLNEVREERKVYA